MIDISHIPCYFGKSVAMATAIYHVTLVNQLPWQSEWNLNNFFVLSSTEFIFGMDATWDNKHQPDQPDTSLLWPLGWHGYHKDTSVTPLS